MGKAEIRVCQQGGENIVNREQARKARIEQEQDLAKKWSFETIFGKIAHLKAKQATMEAQIKTIEEQAHEAVQHLKRANAHLITEEKTLNRILNHKRAYAKIEQKKTYKHAKLDKVIDSATKAAEEAGKK